MNKIALQKALMSQQESLIRAIQEKIESSNTMSDIDETDTLDPEDFSHQTEAGELKIVFEQKLKKAQADLEVLRKIDFSPKKTAESGALITTEHFHFFLGFASIPFDFENKKIVGISIESPIYSFMKGKVKGDTFSYSSNNYQILNIN
jgi:hypothetical protein